MNRTGLMSEVTTLIKRKMQRQVKGKNDGTAGQAYGGHDAVNYSLFSKRIHVFSIPDYCAEEIM